MHDCIKLNSISNREKKLGNLATDTIKSVAGGHDSLISGAPPDGMVSRPAGHIQHPIARLHAGKLNYTGPDVFQYRVNDSRIIE